MGTAQSRSLLRDCVPAVGTGLGPAGMPGGITHGTGMWETWRVPGAALNTCTVRTKCTGLVARSFLEKLKRRKAGIQLPTLCCPRDPGLEAPAVRWAMPPSTGKGRAGTNHHQ